MKAKKFTYSPTLEVVKSGNNLRFRCVVEDICGGKLVSTEAGYDLIMAYARHKKKENENLIVIVESQDGLERYAILDKGKRVNRLWDTRK